MFGTQYEKNDIATSSVAFDKNAIDLNQPIGSFWTCDFPTWH